MKFAFKNCALLIFQGNIQQHQNNTTTRFLKSMWPKQITKLLGHTLIWSIMLRRLTCLLIFIIIQGRSLKQIHWYLHQVTLSLISSTIGSFVTMSSSCTKHKFLSFILKCSVRDIIAYILSSIQFKRVLLAKWSRSTLKTIITIWTESLLIHCLLTTVFGMWYTFNKIHLWALNML